MRRLLSRARGLGGSSTLFSIARWHIAEDRLLESELRGLDWRHSSVSNHQGHKFVFGETRQPVGGRCYCLVRARPHQRIENQWPLANDDGDENSPLAYV